MKIVSISIISCFVFLLVSCSPSIRQLQSYEMVQEIAEQGIIIPLRDASKDIALFNEYGETKKAQQLEQEVMNYNNAIRSAFDNYYNFSAVQYVNEDEEIVQDAYLVRISIEESNRDDRNNYIQQAVISKLSGDTPPIIVTRESSTKPSSNNFIVQQLNRKLNQLLRKAM